MENELDRFARAFATEADLIKTLASLFRRRPGITNVHILDSTHERGKDIVFYAENPLGQRVLHACVVKNKKIAGTVGSPYSPTTVLDQAKQALDTPYHTPTGEEEFVSHVHVLSPYELPPSSSYAIQSGLRGRGTFCCGGELLRMFKDHWADFLFDTGALGIYVTQLHNRIDKEDPVSVLFSDYSVFFGAAAALRKTYVKQRFHITLAKFALAFKAPEISELTKPVTAEEAKVLSQRLKQVLDLVTLPHFSYNSPREVPIDNLARLINAFPDLWRKSYRTYEIQRIGNKETPQPRKYAAVDLRLASTNLDGFDELLNKAADNFSELSKGISEANQFSGLLKELSLQHLSSPGYLKFCWVQEIASLLPSVIKVQERRDVAVPATSLEELGSVLITGAAGYGKSSFCFHHAKEDAKKLLEKKSDLLPVYVKLHQLGANKLGGYEEEFYVTTELRVLASLDNKEGAARIKRIRLYLDGMDEIPRLERQHAVMDLALAARQADPRIEIVVTGRDYVNGPWLYSLPRVKLSELGPEEMKQLVSGLLDNDKSQIDAFYSELDKVPSLKPLIQVPLLATLTVSVFRKRTALPENRIKLYDIFLDLMCGGWDLAKNVRRPTDYGAQGKLTILTRLAGVVHLNRKRDFGVHEVKMAIRDTNRAFEPKYKELLEEIVQDGALIRSGEIYAFKHLSFQEYLAAKDINEPSGRKQLQVLKWYLQGEEWWYQTLAFFVGLVGKPQDTERWILTNAGVPTSGNYAIPSNVNRLLHAISDAFPGYQPRQSEPEMDLASEY
jgi:hypothetical protein